MQRFGYMGERRAEKPNRDEEATHTPAAAGSNYDRQACRDKKEGCAWCARSPVPEPSGRVWKERETGVQWTQEPHRALATAGVAEEAGWGEGGTA